MATGCVKLETRRHQTCAGLGRAQFGAEARATVARMISPAPTLQEIRLSAHAAEQYRHRVKPGIDLDAARAELEQLRLVGEITAIEPRWLNAAKPAPHYLVVRNALALPLLPHDSGWIATTCVTNTTLTPTRRAAKSARKRSLASRKRARRRSRS